MDNTIDKNVSVDPNDYVQPKIAGNTWPFIIFCIAMLLVIYLLIKNVKK